MNIRSAKDEFSLLFPTNASYVSPAELALAEARQAQRAAFSDRLKTMFAWILELPRRRAVLAELNTMSDRELADIGLARSELSNVFKGGFSSAR